MEISTGDLIGLTGLGVTVLGGAVALGKVWSKVNDNTRTTHSIADKVEKLQDDVAEDRTLTMVQESKISSLEENNNKLFELVEGQAKTLSAIESDLKVILTKLEAK